MGWFGLGSVVVELGSLVWWVSVSVSGGCCVVVGSGGGGRGAKPRVGGCALCWVGLGRREPSRRSTRRWARHAGFLKFPASTSVDSMIS